jgi:hypothetical protein
MNNLNCDWLPGLVLLQDSDGVWLVYLDVLYKWFRDDFIRTQPVWPDKRVGLKREPLYQGKEYTFWHFIQKGSVESERLPDIKRCERIRWPRKLIGRFSGVKPFEEDKVVWWKNTRKGEDRFVLALRDFTYIVVVADRGSYVLPWTAYVVEQEHSRLKLQKEFREYWL